MGSVSGMGRRNKRLDPLKYLKPADHLMTTEYVVVRGLKMEPAFLSQVKNTMHSRDWRISRLKASKASRGNTKFDIQVQSTIDSIQMSTRSESLRKICSRFK